ncbi:MAG: ATP synthase F0 subunit A [Deltaproteobacteria bacterium CG11_big_fil_rev_8_21_14_0_20_47_16]|nr:MAG: ATP synthase F0 subunit A [Deltaproteobacteria bacterium CG11_big_fil_rev_8_21_14_0_20_47_16]
MGEHFEWLSFFLGHGVEAYSHVIVAAAILGVLFVSAVIVRARYANASANLVPTSKGGIATTFELAVEGILNLMEGVMGPSARRYLPLIGSLFIYIFVSNLIGMIPGMNPPTGNINTNLACALVVFVTYNVMGVREQGVKNYIKHFMGPIIWLAPLMIVLELVSHLVRPASLSIRLFGNIMGDHMVLGVFTHLTKVGVPVIFLGLALFVSFIQAFVFSLLSMIYISLATSHEEHH